MPATDAIDHPTHVSATTSMGNVNLYEKQESSWATTPVNVRQAASGLVDGTDWQTERRAFPRSIARSAGL